MDVNVKRLEFVDSLKTICALIVVMYHFFGVFYGVGDTAPQYFNDSFPLFYLLFNGDAAVHVFLILSAFSFTFLLDKSDDLHSTISHHIIKRYFRLVLPAALPILICYTLYFVGYYYSDVLAQQTGNEYIIRLSLEHFAKRQVLFDMLFAPIAGSMIDSPLWMYPYLFWCVFIVSILYIVMKCSNKNKLVLLYFLLIFSQVSRFYVSIVLGIILYFVHKCEKYRKRVYACVCGLSLLFLFAMALDASFNNSWLNWRPYFGILQAVFLISIVFNFEIVQHIISTKPLIYVNRYSLQLYMYHWPVINTVICYMYLSICDSFIKIPLLIFATYVVSYFVAVLAYYIYEKPLVNPFVNIITKFIERK